MQKQFLFLELTSALNPLKHSLIGRQGSILKVNNNNNSKIIINNLILKL